MKRIFTVLAAIALSLAGAQAQTWQNIGNHTYGSNGDGTTWSTQRIGNHTYGSRSDGTTWSSQRIGNSTFGSSSDGTNWNAQRIGNSTFINSGGRSITCTTIGQQVTCN